jgi:hypothetical protein
VLNCLTAGYPEGAYLPVHSDTDREVIDAAVATIGTRGPEQARVMHIHNTLSLEEIAISDTLLADDGRPTWTALSEPREPVFDAHGNLAAHA